MTRTRLILWMLFVGLVGAGGACSDDDDSTPEDGSVLDDASMPEDASQVSDGSVDGDAAEPEEDAGGSSALPDDVALPIVFVHGGAGSAQQYASQAMRFAANGYPQDRIVAYDHNGLGFEVEEFIPGLEDVVDDALDDFDADQVYLVGHSRGTLLSNMFLSEASRRAKVAKYISLDGAGCDEVEIPCIGPNQAMLPGQKHVEVATSKESFAMQYAFLVGEEPEVVDIVAQDGPVEVAGRAVDFPANTGADGATLDVWEVEAATGERVEDEPLATFDIGPDGNWGPVTVSPDKHYELLLYSTETGRVQHFYYQPFLRSTYLERLLTGPADSPTVQNSNLGEGHAALVVMRMREFLPSDILEIGVESDSGDKPAQNVITEDNIPLPEGGLGVGEPISIFIHDDVASPQETTLDLLPWFPDQVFQTGIDVYLPAADPPDGVISLTNMPRGDTDKPQTINVPNWASAGHVIDVIFSDFPHE